MPNPVSVKWFTSEMAGAPTISGEVGKLIGVLDACLINGFGSVALDSLVVSGGVATATRGAGHGFLDHTVLLIAGATPSGLNGDKRITWVSSSAFTFDATGIADQTATGTITAKMAPAGWTKPYSGTNKAAYARPALEASAMLLRVDDSGTNSARVRGYETMSDVDTGTGLFPTDVQYSGGLYCAKSSTANTTTRGWKIAADDLGFYFWCDQQSNVNNAVIGYFGDFKSEKAGDAYHCLIAYGVTTTIGSMGPLVSCNSQAGKYVARSHSQLGGSINPYLYAHSKSIQGPGYAGIDYPSAIGGFYLYSLELWETVSLFRGLLRGIYGPLHAAENLTHLQRYTDLTGLEDRAVEIWMANTSGSRYAVAIDLTGPWGS